jgi:hypothetical protein
MLEIRLTPKASTTKPAFNIDFASVVRIAKLYGNHQGFISVFVLVA